MKTSLSQAPTAAANVFANRMRGFDWRSGILLLISAVAIVGLVCIGPVPQDPAYHRFVDTRALFGIRNFWNVVSNLPFLLVGLYGFRRLPYLERPETKAGYVALCAGILLVGIGSAYYHLSPSTPSLLWDRLPMTVAFMALLSIVLEERQALGSSSRTLWPLLVAGIGAAFYWSWTESLGHGDLRPYIVVQFLPMVLIPLVLLLFPGRYLNNTALMFALMWYLVAKAFEQCDRLVFGTIGLLSGHTVKHLLAGLAVLSVVNAVPAVGKDPSQYTCRRARFASVQRIADSKSRSLE